MTRVTVTAWVKVEDGPDLATSVALTPETVSQARVRLDPVGGDEPERTVDLLSSAGSVVLVALSATTAGGSPAVISVVPRNGDDTGATLQVTGALVVANGGVLGSLVEQGPRSLTLTNEGSEAVDVRVIAAHAD